MPTRPEQLRETWFTLTELVDQALTNGNCYIGHVLPNGMTIAEALEEKRDIRERLFGLEVDDYYTVETDF